MGYMYRNDFQSEYNNIQITVNKFDSTNIQITVNKFDLTDEICLSRVVIIFYHKYTYIDSYQNYRRW